MITIVEPKPHIDKLWGKQRIKEDATFRLMRYVLRVDHEGKVLLLNVVTGQLVVLEEEEAAMLERLPAKHEPIMDKLVAEHYLVPEEYDDHDRVVKLRHILWKMVDLCSPKEVTSFIILPTTACNARCWYCFEKGVASITMSEHTADDVVTFIDKQCGGKPVYIWWFGGEPTLAADRIDQICLGLRKHHIEFYSDITTNGYLFDDDMIERAKNLWNLRQASFSLDGTENTYNNVKDFPYTTGNPYQRVMNNAEKLLKNGIAVALRMNFDQNNWKEFKNLLHEASERFTEGSSLMVYPHQINLKYSKEEQGRVEAWFNEKIVELTDLACSYNLYSRNIQELPSLAYKMCGAANDQWFVITPNGNLVCCGEQLANDQIKGDIEKGVWNYNLVSSWKRFSDYAKCQNCVLFPACVSVTNCNNKDYCYRKEEELVGINKYICDLVYSQNKNNYQKGDASHEVSRTLYRVCAD